MRRTVLLFVVAIAGFVLLVAEMRPTQDDDSQAFAAPVAADQAQ
jgi:hypothetical protein